MITPLRPVATSRARHAPVPRRGANVYDDGGGVP